MKYNNPYIQHIDIDKVLANAAIVSAGIKKGTTVLDIKEELSEKLVQTKTPIGEILDPKTLAALAQMVAGGLTTVKENNGKADPNQDL